MYFVPIGWNFYLHVFLFSGRDILQISMIFFNISKISVWVISLFPWDYTETCRHPPLVSNYAKSSQGSADLFLHTLCVYIILKYIILLDKVSISWWGRIFVYFEARGDACLGFGNLGISFSTNNYSLLQCQLLDKKYNGFHLHLMYYLKQWIKIDQSVHDFRFDHSQSTGWIDDVLLSS